VPTGIDHGTVTVIVDGTPFEVTTLRADVETLAAGQGRVRPRLEDRRRAARFHHECVPGRPRGEVFDYVGGLADIDARRVLHRRSGKAHRRGFLRVRFFRPPPTAGPLDPAGLKAPSREGLRSCRAGIRMELLKLLRAEHARRRSP
jgi:poly(A) polymerase